MSLSYFRRVTGGFFIPAKHGGVLATTISMTATLIGATSIIALSAWVIQFGLAASWYLIAPSLGLMALGIWGVNRIRAIDGETLADYFANMPIRYLMMVFLAILYTLVLGAQIVGSAKIMTYFDISYHFAIIFSAGLIATYVAIGGYSSVKDTDVLQFVLFVVAVFTFLIVLPISVKSVEVTDIIEPYRHIGWSKFLLFLSLGMMMLVAQENHQRIKAAKDATTARISCVLSGVIVLTFAITIALISSSLAKAGHKSLLAIIPELGRTSRTLISIGILTAALSTADSALNISSYSLAKTFAREPTLVVIRICVVISVIVATCIAHFFPSIPGIIMICLNLYVGIILPLVALVLFKSSSTLLIVGACLSALSLIIGYIYSFPQPGLIGLASVSVLLIFSKVIHESKSIPSE